MLYQLGYTNLKVLQVELSYEQTSLKVHNTILETADNDINAFIAASVKKAAKKPKPKPVKKVIPKKVIPVKKKKKMPVEGGCQF